MVVATLVILMVGAIFGAIAYLIVPGRRRVPFWAAVLIGVVAMLIGTLLANLVGVGDTHGVDWIELLIQFTLAVAGVGLVASVRHRVT